MRTRDRGIVLAAKPLGENGAVVRFLSSRSGLVSGFVNGARSRKMRAILTVGNFVEIEFDRRTAGALGTARVELERAHTGIVESGLNLSIALWQAALLAEVLPDSEPQDAVFPQTEALLLLLDAGAAPIDAVRALARYELSVLAEVGFRIDLESCAVTGQQDGLAYVSPKSGRAVIATAAKGYEDRLFRLPAFLMDGEADATLSDAAEALAITRHFIFRDLVQAHRQLALDKLRSQIDARLRRLL